MIAALIGGLLWEAIFPDDDGVAWIGSIVVGVVLLALDVMIATRGRTSTPG